MAHACGPCTLCCTLMRVAMEPPKPDRVKCRHCTQTGCGIYEARPEPCRTFECLWLASQRIPSHALPRAMRPDLSGVVIDLNAAGTIIAHCARPASWRREPMHGWLAGYARRTNVVLELPTGVHLLNRQGETEALRCFGVVRATNNRLYVRALPQAEAAGLAS